ncbi:MAG: hypothetical protein B6U87_01230 [Candidatus Aenigmarchaeota archaeon ex4484_52]|nr:MAG: hypothetical protein B6U87_01230 [Candidatus Aenigmarchaeota archaeon ex4484_52]
MEIIEKKPITLLEAKEILNKREKNEEKELSHMQSITLEFLRKKTSKLDIKKQKEIYEKLNKEVPELKENQIISILNTPPKDVDELDVIFSKERIILDKPKKEKIIKISSAMQ